jgi:hypothetical protein
MQKRTKDLFLILKGLHPSVVAISEYYGSDWKSDHIIMRYYLEYNCSHLPFDKEEDLQTKLRELIASTESDLGFRYPNTVKHIYKKE